MHNTQCNVNNVYFILYSHYKSIGYCAGASKQSPDLKNFTGQGLCPTVLKFLDPPLRPIVCWVWKEKTGINYLVNYAFNIFLNLHLAAGQISVNPERGRVFCRILASWSRPRQSWRSADQTRGTLWLWWIPRRWWLGSVHRQGPNEPEQVQNSSQLFLNSSNIYMYIL